MRRPITSAVALQRLAEAQRPGGLIDPLAAAIAIGSHARPSLVPAEVLKQIDGFAREVRGMTAKGSAFWGSANHVLFDRHGFKGNRERYSDPQNSYIDQVLARRTGLPIMLSLIYVETVRRAGGQAYGIGLPGHFIAGVQENGERILVDAFNAGTPLSVEDCKSIALSTGAAWSEDSLEPLAGRRFAMRMLLNLRNVYAQMADAANTAAVVEQMVLLEPAMGNQQEELKRLYAYLDQQSARNN